MPVIELDSLDDARVGDYRSLRDRVLRRDGGRFMVEGRRLLLRLIAAGQQPISVLTDAKQLEAIRDRVDPQVPIYVVDTEGLTRIAGIAIHTGVLAVAKRPAQPTLTELAGPVDHPATLIVCEQIKEVVNMGSLIRTATAFGVRGMVIGPECCDPYYRRSVRVSMGTVFKMPIYRSDDLVGDMGVLRGLGVHVYAAELHERSVDLTGVKPAARSAIALGHEVEGLTAPLLDACDTVVKIPMANAVDSLNVAVSAAVFLYRFTQAG